MIKYLRYQFSILESDQFSMQSSENLKLEVQVPFINLVAD